MTHACRFSILHKYSSKVLALRIKFHACVLCRLKRLLRRKRSGGPTRSEYSSPVAKKYQSILDKSLRSMNTALAVAERSLAVVPPPSEVTAPVPALSPPRIRRRTRVLEPAVKAAVTGQSALEDEFESETMSELGSQSESQAHSDSGKLQSMKKRSSLYFS